MIEVNPYGVITWTKYTLGDGDTFGSYRLKRLNPHTEAYDLIAVVTDIDTTSFNDHLAWPGANTYRLTVSIETGGIVLESDPDDASGTLTFAHLWAHETPDPTEAVQLLASSVDMPRRQGQEWRLAAGRREETAFVGPLLSRDIALQLAPEAMADPVMMAALDRFLDRQYTHARVLCLRWGGRDGSRWFVRIRDGVGESLATSLSRGRVTFRQVAYEEAP